jgi:hypothetical protein
MTIPLEELYALRHTREFLLDLVDPQKTPNVQARIRKQAMALLKHYPFDFRLEDVWNPMIQEWNINLQRSKY